jgi:ribosomal protein S18 acetylase RimI-like enzyme
VPLKFRDATLDDVAAIAGLQNAAPGALTALAQRHARVRIGRDGKRILTVLRLATKKPWAVDVSYFTPVRRPLYLTGMAVSVAHQGHGLGSMALEDGCTIAEEWPADAIRLDAYDANAGAGGFYARGGLVEPSGHAVERRLTCARSRILLHEDHPGRAGLRGGDGAGGGRDRGTYST